MATCLIGLGSNLGNRTEQLNSALAALRADPSLTLLRCSSFLETAPIGGPAGQPKFLNAAALVETTIAPRELLAKLQATEARLGRVRGEHWGPRTIDLDLLLYGDAVISTPELMVPHPRLAQRRFVLVPAAEIAAEMVDPVSALSIAALLADLGPASPGDVGLRIFTDPSAIQWAVRQHQREGRHVGLVPTMGALHEGHVSLVRLAREQADIVVATIFVNPTQFGPQEDFARYPRTLEADLAALASAGCDLVLVPDRDAVYPPGCSTVVEPPSVAVPLEGDCRPGHFRGVTTIVLKLFGMVPADVACFGQKDYQQSLVIRRMVADLNVPIQIVVCPIVREADGLAMSSRNRYLSPDERQRALAISRSLHMAEAAVASGERDAAALIKLIREELSRAGIVRIDYVAVANPETLADKQIIDAPVVALIAAHVGSTRLIDNCLLQPPSETHSA